MKSIIAAAFFLLFSSLAFATSETYDEEGMGFADTKNKACSQALLFAKRDALDSAGTIIRASSQSNTQVKNKSVDKVASVDISELSNRLVKVLNKSQEMLTDKEGKFICRVKAKLSVDTSAVQKHNKTYEGQIPDWAITPPRILGKHTIVASSESLDGAVALVVKNYFEANFPDKLEDFDSVMKKLGDGDSSVTKRITSEEVNSNFTLKGMTKIFVDSKDIVYTDIANVSMKLVNKERVIKFYREHSQNSPNEELVEVVKDSASIETMIDNLKTSGFNVEFEHVVSGNLSEWFVMLIGEKKMKVYDEPVVEVNHSDKDATTLTTTIKKFK